MRVFSFLNSPKTQDPLTTYESGSGLSVYNQTSATAGAGGGSEDVKIGWEALGKGVGSTAGDSLAVRS